MRARHDPRRIIPLRWFGWLFITTTAVAVGCGSPAAPDPLGTPSPKGTPTGAAIVRSIGPGGGSLTSSDGVLTLVVPAGAVSSATDFSIQPITGPGVSRVNAYRLLPDGARFPTPVTLTFVYTDEEVGNSDPQGLGIAYQDANGIWRAMLASTVNTATRTVSVASTHFTDFTKASLLTIVPANTVVNTFESVPVSVKTCVSEAAANRAQDPPVVFTDDELAPLPSCSAAAERISWAVNNVTGGDGTVGTIKAGNPSSNATYTAPANQPNPRTVTVSATMTWLVRGKIVLISRVTIGGPRVHVVGTYAGEEIIGAFYILSNVTDRVEFDLDLNGESSRSDGVINTTSTHSGDRLRQPSEACGFEITGTYEFATITEVHPQYTATREVETVLSGQAQYPAHTLRFPSVNRSTCDETREVAASTDASAPVTFRFDPAKLDSIGSSVQVRGLPNPSEFIHPENWTFTVTRTK